MRIDEVSRVNDPQFLVGVNNIIAIMNASIANPNTMMMTSFEQMNVVGLRKITEVVNGKNKDQKLKLITSIIYGTDLGNIRAKVAAGDALKLAMEESIKFAITNQYSNERSDVDWTKFGADAFDVILSRACCRGSSTGGSGSSSLSLKSENLFPSLSR